MPYFVAVLARVDGRWAPKDLDLEELSDLAGVDEVADTVRDVADGGAPALLLLEREDDWFSVVRVDDDDTRLVVSDAAAATSSPYAEALGLDPDGDPSAAPAGDVDLLEDLGVPADRLVALCGGDAPTPADALIEIARVAGFEDVLDAMR
jgi:putative tRNA adenosine deaminase-associated protein